MGNVVPSPGITWPKELTVLQSALDTRGGLTAREWDRYEYLLKQYDPAAHQARIDRYKRRRDMEAARRLSVDDLKTILAEKTVAA